MSDSRRNFFTCLGNGVPDWLWLTSDLLRADVRFCEELGWEKLTDCTCEVENLRLFSFCWTEDKGVEESDNLPTFDFDTFPNF